MTESTTSETSSYIYVMGSVESRLVKIGVTYDLKKRLSSLQTGSPVPLHLLWHAQAGPEVESMLHKHFKMYRRRGEWFDFGNLDPVTLISETAFKLASVNGIVTEAPIAEKEPAICPCGHAIESHNTYAPHSCSDFISGPNVGWNCSCKDYAGPMLYHQPRQKSRVQDQVESASGDTPLRVGDQEGKASNTL